MKRLVTCLTIVVVCILMGCTETPASPFWNGDMVQMKLDGRVGMIVGVWGGSRGYNIRFPLDGLEVQTDTHLLSKDGPASIVSKPYVILERVREYEFQRYIKPLQHEKGE